MFVSCFQSKSTGSKAVRHSVKIWRKKTAHVMMTSKRGKRSWGARHTVTSRISVICHFSPGPTYSECTHWLDSAVGESINEYKESVKQILPKCPVSVLMNVLGVIQEPYYNFSPLILKNLIYLFMKNIFSRYVRLTKHLTVLSILKIPSSRDPLEFNRNFHIWSHKKSKDINYCWYTMEQSNLCYSK